MSFEDKKKKLFDCLTTAEESIKGTSLEQRETYIGYAAPSSPTKVKSRRFQGKESIFKRPEAPIGKCLRPRKAPDYQINPHKWKLYSLSDVDVSDRTNTSAAFAFLSEIEKRKEAEQEMRSEDNKQSEIKFKSRKSKRSPNFNPSVQLRRMVQDEEIEEKAILKGSKVVMPEYVVGKKRSEKRRRTETSSSKEDESSTKSKNAPQLQHLFEADEEID